MIELRRHADIINVFYRLLFIARQKVIARRAFSKWRAVIFHNFVRCPIHEYILELLKGFFNALILNVEAASLNRYYIRTDFKLLFVDFLVRVATLGVEVDVFGALRLVLVGLLARARLDRAVQLDLQADVMYFHTLLRKLLIFFFIQVE